MKAIGLKLIFREVKYEEREKGKGEREGFQVFNIILVQRKFKAAISNFLDPSFLFPPILKWSFWWLIK